MSTCDSERLHPLDLGLPALLLGSSGARRSPACAVIAAGQGGGWGTYREDVGAPLGLLADGRGGGGGSDGLDAQLPLADAGGGRD